MTPTTNREKMLMLILPAGADPGLVQLQAVGPADAAHNGRNGTWPRPERTTPAPVQFQAKHKRIADLNLELADIEKQNIDWAGRWKKLQDDRSTDSTLRIEAIEDLTALLNHNRLTLIDEEPAEGNDSRQAADGLGTRSHAAQRKESRSQDAVVAHPVRRPVRGRAASPWKS